MYNSNGHVGHVSKVSVGHGLSEKSSILCKLSREDFYNLFTPVLTNSNKVCLVIIDSEKITAMTSNNRILAVSSIEKFTDFDDSKQYLFYTKAIRIALKALRKSNTETVTLYDNGAHIAIEIGNTTIQSVLIDKPCQWQTLFPQGLQYFVNFEREEAINALKALKTTNSYDSVVTLSCNSDSNKMTIKTSMDTTTIFARANGTFDVSFDIDNLLDILEHIPEYIDPSGITLNIGTNIAHITARSCLCRYDYLMPL